MFISSNVLLSNQQNKGSTQFGQSGSQNLASHSKSNAIIIYQTQNLRGFEMFVDKNQLQQQSQHQSISDSPVNQIQANPPSQKTAVNDEEHIGIQIHKLQSSLQPKRESMTPKTNIINESINRSQLICLEPMFQTFQYDQNDLSGNHKLCSQACTNLPVQSVNRLKTLRDVPIEFGSFGQPEEEQEIDLQLSDCELPLGLMSKYGNGSSFQQPSDSSDDIQYVRHHNFNSITFFNEKKEGDDLQSSEQLLNCRKCHLLDQTNKGLMDQINEMTKELSFLKPMAKFKMKMQDKSKCGLRSTNSHDDGSSNISIEVDEHNPSPQVFLQQLNELSRVMETLCKNQAHWEMSLTEEERESFLTFETLLLSVKKLFQIEQEEAEEPKKGKSIHQKYKKLIQGLKTEHREQIDKIGEDFKRFMNLLSEKSEIKLGLQDENRQQRGDKSRVRMRKVKTLVDRQQLACYNQQQHNKQLIELLEINYEKQKSKVKDYERYYKKILAKHSRDVGQLKRQRNCYADTVRRYQKEFESIMTRIAKSKGRLEINSCELFKNISQRIFEISNCIPFQENDEQNLFVPENQTEVYDMLERIRCFYLKIEDFTAKKEREVFGLKRNFIFFLKDLIQNDKISIRYTIELISRNKELELDYIKDYVNSLRKRKLYSPKKTVKTKNLSLVKTESYSYTQQEGFDQ